MSWHLSRDNDAVISQAERWERDRLISRLWDRDPTVWSIEPVPEIEDRLGWLTLHDTSRDLVPLIEQLHDDDRVEAVDLNEQIEQAITICHADPLCDANEALREFLFFVEGH